MKVALCLSGLVGSMIGPAGKVASSGGHGGLIHPAMGKHFLEKTLLNNHDTDVFLHSWSTELKDEIESTWNPKLGVIEKQIDFKVDIKKYGIDNDLIKLSKDKRYAASVNYHSKYNKEGKAYTTQEEGNNRYFEHMKNIAWRAHSRWYSNSESIKLKQKYEKENGFKYDWVLLSRFDVFYNKTFNLKDLDKNCFYGGSRYSDSGSKRHDYDFAFEDFWYLASSDVMDKFGNLVYDNIYDYCIDSPYSAREVATEIVGEKNIKLLQKARGGSDFNLIRNVYAPMVAQNAGNSNTIWKL